jgi:hypothetical protein
MLKFAFWPLFVAVLVQLPAWFLVGLNALAFQISKELTITAIYFTGLLVGWLLYMRSYQKAGLAILAATLLFTLYCWRAVMRGTPL